MRQAFLLTLLASAVAPAQPPQQAAQVQAQAAPPEKPMTDELVLQRVAEAIEKLKPRFPQLTDFSAAKHFDRQRLVISYSWHTHPPTHRGGWTSGVPNPDPDGLWFYVDVHDPDSMAQIHTQPVVEPLWLGKRKVMFLILEGKETKNVAGEIRQLLLNHGVRHER